MSNSYSDTILEGQRAYNVGDKRHQDNPYAWHSVSYYAWDCGWTQAQREANPRPSDVDLELEASLVAYGESVQR